MGSTHSGLSACTGDGIDMTAILGPIMQNGYLVDDLETAAMHWATRLGVGPFFVFPSVAFDTIRFRGKDSPIEMSMAIGYWGDMQIELIRPLNDAPSIYSEFTARGHKGLQHVGVLTDDLARDLKALATRDVLPIQDGRAANGTEFAYVETDFHPGGMVEIIQISPALDAGFAMIKRASINWDGTNPVRVLR